MDFKDQDAVEFVDSSSDQVFHVKDPETGEVLNGERTVEYHRLMAKFSRSYCTHETAKTMRVRLADGRPAVFDICMTCGERRGTAKSFKDRQAWFETLEWLEDGLAQPYETRRKLEQAKILLDLARRQTNERGAFTSFYKEYIVSPLWRRKCELVMQRATGVCEACGECTATEVHHHHYDNFGDEYLWDLAAVCSSCHEKLTKAARARRND